MSPKLIPSSNCPHCLGNTRTNENLCKKHFKRLQKIWYKKIEDSGFEDIEQSASFKSGAPDGNLKQWSSSFFSSPSRFNAEVYKSKEEYYRLAGQFLHDFEFASAVEKGIWELHAAGYSIASIVKVFHGLEIRSYAGKLTNIRNIKEILNKLTQEMIGKTNK